jgi:uncharacterized protein YecT (DUF1311 family)
LKNFLPLQNDAAFNFYKKYISDHGPEPNLPGFLLSNEQMFWVAMQNKKCEKDKVRVEADSSRPSIRSPTAFRETFHCQENKSAKGWIEG